MKKLSLILVLVLTASILLSGCGGGPAKDASNAGTASTGAAEPTKAANTGGQTENGSSQGTVTLKFMGWEASPLETKSVKKGIETFQAANPNIKVDYTPVPGAQYTSKLLTMMAGNAAPDTFFCSSADYRAFQKRGVLLDLTSSFNAEFKKDEFIPSSMQIMEINGKIFGISSCTVSPVLYYNKDIFDKLKMAYPPSDPAKAWTWEEFAANAKKLTLKEGGKVTQYGAYGLENFYMTTALILANGGKIFNDDITKSSLNSPETKQVLQAILDLRKKDGACPENKTLQDIGMKPAQMLQTGKVAMMVDGSWALQELATMKFPVGVGVLPKFKNAQTHGQAHVHSAWAKTSHPQEAWKFLGFLSSEQYQSDLIREGLWMPNRKSLYSEEGVAKWYNKSVHPDGFKDMVPYFADAAVYPFALTDKSKINDINTEEMDKFWYSNQSVDDTAANIEKRVNEELAKTN